ncbi:MAG TPA: hypothetical protein VG839_03895 [Asticcacaulis sp.]|nr:hypothetical protein [Asticcacaulis sp.]
MTIDWKRLGKSLLAAFIGSWLGCALFLALSDLFGGGPGLGFGDILPGLASFFRLLFSPFGLFAFLPMLVVGLPVQALLQRAGKTAYLWNIIPAVIAGAITFPLILISFGATAGGDFTGENMGMGALAAFLVGSIAWLIRRPDKDAALPS